MKLLIKLISIIFIATLPAQAGDDYDMKNPHHPTDNILTGGQPSVADVAKLKANGIKTIINLRRPTERDQSDIKAAASKAGITYINIPVNGSKDITLATAKLLSEALQFTHDDKVLVHCGSGNRVGALMAIKAHFIDGKSKSEALAFGKKSGMTRLQPVVEALLKEE